MTTPDTPAAAAPAAPASPAPSQTAAAISAARERLADGRPLIEEPATESAEPAAPSEEAPPSNLTVTLPGMEERGEKPLDLEAPDQETYERLNRLTNEASIGREVKQARREIQHSRTELAEVEDKIAIDPTGFVLNQIQETDRTEIAMQLFFEPGVLDAIQAKLREAGVEGGIADVLESPDALRTLRAELKASRLEMRDRLRQSTERRRTMEANAERVIGEIERLIPESVTGEQRELLFRDAVRDVKDRVQRLGLTEIAPEDVQLLVTQRLRGHEALRGAGTRGPVGSGAGAAPARRTAAATMPAELPAGSEKRIALARKVGLKALVEMAQRTTTETGGGR